MTSSDPAQITSDSISTELQQILADVDSFLNDWIRSADQAISVPVSPEAAMVSVRRRFREFEEEKRQWSLRRERELAFIEEKAALLADTWLRLEAEQRGSGSSTAQPTRSIASPQPVNGDPNVIGNDTVRPKAGSSLSQSLSGRSSEPPTTNRRIAEFRRLKQEVRSKPG